MRVKTPGLYQHEQAAILKLAQTRDVRDKRETEIPRKAWPQVFRKALTHERRVNWGGIMNIIESFVFILQRRVTWSMDKGGESNSVWPYRRKWGYGRGHTADNTTWRSKTAEGRCVHKSSHGPSFWTLNKCHSTLLSFSSDYTKDAALMSA